MYSWPHSTIVLLGNQRFDSPDTLEYNKYTMQEIPELIAWNDENRKNLSGLKREQSEAQKSLQETTGKITETQGQMDDLQKDIETKKWAIDKLEGEQEKTKNTINEQKEALKNPLLTLEERGVIEKKIQTDEASLKKIQLEIQKIEAEKNESQKKFDDLKSTMPELISQSDDFSAEVDRLWKLIEPLDQKLAINTEKVANNIQKSYDILRENEEKFAAEKQQAMANEFAPQDWNKVYWMYA